MVALFRRIGPAGILLLAALVLVVPAPARAAGCPEQPAAQTFLPWLDLAWYVPAPDGTLEGGGEEWTLGGGAHVVDGGNPLLVGDRGLALPGGATATTAPMCIGVEHPTIRLFARNGGAPDSKVAVSVVFQGESIPVGVIAAGPRWAPTPIYAVGVNLLALTGDQQAAFRFTALDDRGAWTIDDAYVDPYKKR
jgi:hypothetical protein